MPEPLTQQRVDAMCDAFNRHDLEEVMSYFADDAVFINAKGADGNGQRFEGKEEIRKIFGALFDAMPDIQWIGTNTVCGNRVISEWRRTATAANGEKQDWLGCDLYTFRDGKVVIKDAYFKIIE